jgi:hypothetical protein
MAGTLVPVFSELDQSTCVPVDSVVIGAISGRVNVNVLFVSFRFGGWRLSKFFLP